MSSEASAKAVHVHEVGFADQSLMTPHCRSRVQERRRLIRPNFDYNGIAKRNSPRLASEEASRR